MVTNGIIKVISILPVLPAAFIKLIAGKDTLNRAIIQGFPHRRLQPYMLQQLLTGSDYPCPVSREFVLQYCPLS